MAAEKDTDPVPDESRTGSDSASPETPGEVETPDELAGELEELDALDQREDEFDSDQADEDRDEGRDDDESDGDESDGDRELVGVGAASRAGKASGGSSATVSRSTTTGRGPKNRATPKQRTGEDKPKRTGPVGFVKGSVSELKKVVYPTGPQLGNYFVVVLVFVLIVIAIVTGLDYGFGWVMLKVFT